MREWRTYLLSRLGAAIIILFAISSPAAAGNQDAKIMLHRPGVVTKTQCLRSGNVPAECGGAHHLPGCLLPGG